MATDTETLLDASKRPAPGAYRSFSPRLGPALLAAGGTLGALGALGTWIRATRLATEGGFPEQATVVRGTSGGGWFLAVLGVVVVAAALAWRRRWLREPLQLGVLASLAFVALAAVRVWSIDRDARAVAAAARSRADFVAYHASFGWGAWLLLVGTLLAALGLVLGLLRELDARTGRIE